MFRKTNNGAMQKARSTWWPAGSDLTLFSTRPMKQWEWFVFPRSGHPGGISRFRGAFALTTELVAGGVLGACNPKALRYTMSPTTLASPGVDRQLHGCEGASAWMRVGVWAHRGYLRSPVVQTTQAKSPPAFFWPAGSMASCAGTSSNTSGQAVSSSSSSSHSLPVM